MSKKKIKNVHIHEQLNMFHINEPIHFKDWTAFEEALEKSFINKSKFKKNVKERN